MFGIHKFCCLLLCALLWLPLSAADDAKQTPTMPSEVTLTSGRVLRKVQVMGWKKDAVLLKSAAGLETVPFAVIKQPAPADLKLMRDAGLAQIEAESQSIAQKKKEIAALDAEIAATRERTAAAQAEAEKAAEEAREQASRAGKLMVGQTEDQVRRFLGGWARRNKTRDMEQVIFELDRGVTYYVYFKDGRVVDWEELQRRR